MKIITVQTLTALVARHGFERFLKDLIEKLRYDYGRWEEFNKMPRPAMHVPGGVLELMPVCDDAYYSFKYVNCHPKNTSQGLQTVVATGQLSRVDTGYPIMYSEMTLLTALRTAATSALATDLMARKDAKVVAIIGTGAQSEFQIRGLKLVRDISEVRFFDTDAGAMEKFERNIRGTGWKLARCASAEEALRTADIITTCTATKAYVDVLSGANVEPGTHINAIGGDCPGKTELDSSLLKRSRVVVEYFDQACAEGEIQQFPREEARQLVSAELHEVVGGSKVGRAHDEEITLFDSVGIALEDYSALTLVYDLASRYGLGEEMEMIPDLANPKDLISVCGSGEKKKENIGRWLNLPLSTERGRMRAEQSTTFTGEWSDKMRER